MSEPVTTPVKSRSWFARHKILTGIGVLILLIAIGSVASGGGKKSGGTPAGSSKSSTKNTKALQHLEDVTVSKCAPDDAGFAAAVVTVKNSSSKPSNYIVTITFESPDGKTQVGSGIAAVNNLAAGQSASESASSLKAASGNYVCKVADVTRYAA